LVSLLVVRNQTKKCQSIALAPFTMEENGKSSFKRWEMIIGVEPAILCKRIVTI
jgi:hypothetical protein